MSKARYSCLGTRRPEEPFSDAHQVQRGRRENVLQMRFCQTHIAGMPQAASPDTLFVRTFYSRTCFVRFLKLRRFLTPARGMQRFILLPRLQHQLARFFLGTGTVGTMFTGITVFLGETHVPTTALCLRFRAGQKRKARLPGRTGNDLILPIDKEFRLVKAFARL